MAYAIYTSSAFLSATGLSVASDAAVEVRNESDNSIATIYSTRTGTVKSNPFVADSSGRFDFYAAGGAYKITITSGSESHVARYQAIGTAAEYDAPDTPGTAQALRALVTNSNNEIGSLGNVGIQTAVTGWGAGQKALDVGATGAEWTGTANTVYNRLFNLYHNGTNYIYKTDGFASAINQQAAGAIVIQTAPSGVANNIATLTTVFQIANDGTTTINGNTVYHAGNLSLASRGALVTHSGGQTVNDTAILAFDTEVYDTDAIHDTSTNNSRLTVPSGVSKVRLSAGASWGASTAEGAMSLYILKNTASFVGRGFSRVRSAGYTGHSSTTNQECHTPIIAVSPGDYFEVTAYQDTGFSLSVIEGASSGMTWFAMEVIE